MTGDDTDADGFQVATGATPSAATEPAEHRETEVRDAFASLLHIRRVMNTGVSEPAAVPAEWEWAQMVRAISLTLEAADLPPAIRDPQGRPTQTGYCVTPTEHPQVVRVEWLGPWGSGAIYEEERELQRCAKVLRGLGWVVLEYRGPRGRRHLEVEAPSAIRR
ncbi:hypothetical protein ACQUSR_00220 [Streptomyces sp. P1-3]|uniref:hypothetical protein n=1 Tax=Streptomyces sp. P1-3 TaxID=3421658 RepID=UPI003D3608F2